MATLPRLNIPVHLLGQQYVQDLMKMNAANKWYNVTLTETKQKAQAASDAIGKGIGSFLLFSTVMRATTGVMRAGITAAAEQEVALNRLRIIMNLTGGEAETFYHQAQQIANSLGMISTTDTIKMLEQLSHTLGSTKYTMQQTLPIFATVADTMALISGNKTSPEAAANIYRQILTPLGGIQDPKRAEANLRSSSAFLERYFADDPQRFLTSFKPAVSALEFARVPSEQIMALTAAGSLLGAGGARGGGVGIARLISEILKGPPTGKSGHKAWERHVSAAHALGLTPEAFAPGGVPNISRFMQILGGAAADPNKRQQVSGLFKDLLGSEVAIRFAKGFGIRPGVFDEILDAVHHMAPAEVRAAMARGTFTGATETFRSNMGSVLGTIFGDPARQNSQMTGGLARIINASATGLGMFNNFQMRAGSAFNNAMAAVLMAGVTSILLRTFTMLPIARTIAMGLAQIVLGSVGPKILGAALTTLGVASIIALTIGAVVIAGIAAYRLSPAFKRSVDDMASAFTDAWRDTVMEVKNLISHPLDWLSGANVHPKRGMLHGLAFSTVEEEHMIKHALRPHHRELFTVSPNDQFAPDTPPPATQAPPTPRRTSSKAMTQHTLKEMLHDIISDVVTRDAQSHPILNSGSARLPVHLR